MKYGTGKLILILTFVFVIAFSVFGDDAVDAPTYPEPEIVWTLETGSTKAFFVQDIDKQSDPDFFTIEERSLVDKSKITIKELKVDASTGEIENEIEKQVEVTSSNCNLNLKAKRTAVRSVITSEEKRMIFQLYCYKILAFKQGTEEFAYEINYEKINTIIDYDFIEKKNVLILYLAGKYLSNPNYIATAKYKQIKTFNIETGEELYTIDLPIEVKQADFKIIAHEGSGKLIYSDLLNIYVHDIVTGEELNKTDSGLKKEYKNIIFDEDLENNVVDIITEGPFTVLQIDLVDGHFNFNIDIEDADKSEYGCFISKLSKYNYVAYHDETPSNNGIICIDIEDQKVVWSKKLPTNYFINPVEIDETIVVFDKKYIYLLNQDDGNEIWKAEIQDVKNVKVIGNKLFVGIGFPMTNNSLKKEFGYSGFARVDLESGAIDWKFEAQSPVLQYYAKKNVLYLVDDERIYGIDYNDGSDVMAYDFKDKNDGINIIGAYLTDNSDNFLILTEKTFSLVNISDYSTVSSSKMVQEYFMYEIYSIGTQVFLTTMGITKPGMEGLMNPSYVYQYSINIETGNVDWVKKVSTSASTSLPGFYSGYLIDYIGKGSSTPGRKIYSNNLYLCDGSLAMSYSEAMAEMGSMKEMMALAKELKPLTELKIPEGSLRTAKIIGYKIFNNDYIPTDDEVENITKVIGFDDKAKNPRVALQQRIAGLIISMIKSPSPTTMIAIVELKLQIKEMNRAFFYYSQQ